MRRRRRRREERGGGDRWERGDAEQSLSVRDRGGPDRLPPHSLPAAPQKQSQSQNQGQNQGQKQNQNQEQSPSVVPGATCGGHKHREATLNASHTFLRGDRSPCPGEHERRGPAEFGCVRGSWSGAERGGGPADSGREGVKRGERREEKKKKKSRQPRGKERGECGARVRVKQAIVPRVWAPAE